MAFMDGGLQPLATYYNSRVNSPTQAEHFTEEEAAKLAPYFTNSDKHVFALTNLPETVKGALFARYSRTAKSLRRLFLDEFAPGMAAFQPPSGDVGTARAEKLYARVFNEYRRRLGRAAGGRAPRL